MHYTGVNGRYGVATGKMKAHCAHLFQCHMAPITNESTAVIPAELLTTPLSHKRISRIAIVVTVFLSLLAAAICLQWVSGAYGSEMGHFPDEPSHFITALMIRDYITAHFPAKPLAFAEDYYIHYPKVAFGMWPPVFHITAAIWMLLFSGTHTSALVFMAVQCAVFGSLLVWFAMRLFPTPVAFGLGLMLVCLPLTQYGTSLFMVDLLVSIWQFLAMILFVQFFRTHSMRWALAFGTTTAIAMLTKGNAIALVLLPPIMMLIARDFSLLRSRGLYASGAIIVLLGGPWQILIYRLFQNTIPLPPLTVLYVWHTARDYIAILARLLGAPLLSLAALGLAVEVWHLVRLRRNMWSYRDMGLAGSAALLLSIFVFHCVLPHPAAEERYMTGAQPVLLIFAACGIRWLATRVPVPFLQSRTTAALLATAVVLLFAANTFFVPRRPVLGFGQLAQTLSKGPMQNDTVLVCSDAVGEGAFITSLALRDPRREHIVLRGSKVLSENTWTRTTHRPLVQDSAELDAYLRSVPVDSVVVDQSETLWEQDRALLLATLSSDHRWQLVAQTDNGSSERRIQLFRRADADTNRPVKRDIRVRMRLMLGRDLELRP